MKLYFAPLEGITTYTFRNAHAEMFGMCDAYFAPFITPTENEKVGMRNIRDILPDNNYTKIKVQVLSNNKNAFIDFSNKIARMGYDEINLNLGCPSGTVVKKGRGSGFLKNTDELDRFFEGVFSETDIKISVKTRTGFFSHDEFEKIMEIYNKYPLSELIVHPRIREEYYKGSPNHKTFKNAYIMSKNKLCYNGDIFSLGDFEKIVSEYKNLQGIMIGRGAIKNPAIFREIRGGDKLQTVELIEFSKLLEKRYLNLLKSEVYTLQKLKEIWMYIMWNFPEENKILKAIKKSGKLSDFNMAINCLPEL